MRDAEDVKFCREPLAAVRSACCWLQGIGWVQLGPQACSDGLWEMPSSLEALTEGKELRRLVLRLHRRAYPHLPACHDILLSFYSPTVRYIRIRSIRMHITCGRPWQLLLWL